MPSKATWSNRLRKTYQQRLATQYWWLKTTKYMKHSSTNPYAKLTQMRLLFLNISIAINRRVDTKCNIFIDTKDLYRTRNCCVKTISRRHESCSSPFFLRTTFWPGWVPGRTCKYNSSQHYHSGDKHICWKSNCRNTKKRK